MAEITRSSLITVLTPIQTFFTFFRNSIVVSFGWTGFITDVVIEINRFNTINTLEASRTKTILTEIGTRIAMPKFIDIFSFGTFFYTVVNIKVITFITAYALIFRFSITGLTVFTTFCAFKILLTIFVKEISRWALWNATFSKKIKSCLALSAGVEIYTLITSRWAFLA